MKTQKFKTNINCGNCLAKVTSWSVDLQSEDRILSVESEDITSDEVFKTVLKAGFIAKPE